LWYNAKGIFYPQRPVIAEACEYVGRKCENEVKFSQKLFLFAQILKKQVSPEQKEETVTDIAREWSVLRPMIKEYIHSDKLDSTTKDKMMIILSNMQKYSKQYSVIFQRDEDTKKQDIKGRRFFSKTDSRDDETTLRGHNDKKSTSTKPKTKKNEYYDDSRKGRRHKDESDDDVLKIISKMDRRDRRKSKRESSDDSDDDHLERRLIRLPRDRRESKRESSDDSDDDSLDDGRLNRRQRYLRKNRRSFDGSLPASFSEFW